MEQQPPYYEDDEITLKELILKIKEFWQELWRNKFLIIAVAALLAGLFLAKTIFLDQTTYQSTLSFMVDEDNSSNGSPVAELLGYGTFSYNFERITELAKSGRIVNSTLLSEITMNDKKDLVANHLIDIYNLQEGWKEEANKPEFEDLSLAEFYFTGTDLTAYGTKEFRALKILQSVLVGGGGRSAIMNISFNKKTSIFTLTTTTANSELSAALIKAIYESISQFYIEETVIRPQNTYDVLSERKDSIETVLKRLEGSLASATDRTEGLLSGTYRLSIDRLSRKVNATNQQYGEILRNLEKIEFLLQNQKPSFQIIDRSYIPAVMASSKVKAILIGGFLGGFLAGFYVIGRKIVRDALRD